MEEISLNEQQVSFLRETLADMTDYPYSKFSQSIALSILRQIEKNEKHS